MRKRAHTSMAAMLPPDLFKRLILTTGSISQLPSYIRKAIERACDNQTALAPFIDAAHSSHFEKLGQQTVNVTYELRQRWQWVCDNHPGVKPAQLLRAAVMLALDGPKHIPADKVRDQAERIAEAARKSASVRSQLSARFAPNVAQRMPHPDWLAPFEAIATMGGTDVGSVLRVMFAAAQLATEQATEASHAPAQE